MSVARLARRRIGLIRHILPVLVLLAGVGIAQAEVTATDLRGRQVTLPEPAKRIVLGEGRHLQVLGILHDDPVALVAGWREDKSLDPATAAAYAARFPAISGIASVGAGNRMLSVESVIALEPDLVVLSLRDVQDPQMAMPMTQLEAAGIPVATVDFFVSPLDNSIESLRILGALTGAEARAEEFVAFYDRRLGTVLDRLAEAAPQPPRVFVHAHAAALNCCATVGQGVYDDFVTAAGGSNVGRELVPGVLGNVGLENLIAADPDFYIASGGQHMASRGGLVLGPGIDPATATSSFEALIGAPGFADLRAVRDGAALGFWHLFNDFPAHIALIEMLAKHFHPDLFADLDPDATMREFETRFSPVALNSIWWISQ